MTPFTVETVEAVEAEVGEQGSMNAGGRGPAALPFPAKGNHTPGFMFLVPDESLVCCRPKLVQFKISSGFGKTKGKKKTIPNSRIGPHSGKTAKKGSPQRRGPTNSWASSARRPGLPSANIGPLGLYIPAGWRRSDA